MSNKTQLEVLSNLGACVGNYVSHYGKRRSIKAIVTEKTYEFLQELGLLKQSKSISSIQNRDILINPEHVEIEVYRESQLSKKDQSRLQKLTQKMLLPLCLGKGRLNKILTSKFPQYNLAADSALFAYL